MANLPISYNAQFAKFLQVGSDEEAIDQPLYHIQSYAAAGSLQFTFFNVTNGASGVNGYSDTNMTTASILSAGNRYLIRSVSVFFTSGVSPQVYNSTSMTSYLNDVKAVLEATAYLQFDLNDKPYLRVAPLTYFPAGFGVFAPHASQNPLQASAADKVSYSSHATNGFPAKGAIHQLTVPLVIPELFRFQATLNFASLATLPSSTAGRIGVVLNGLLIRPVQ